MPLIISLLTRIFGFVWKAATPISIVATIAQFTGNRADKTETADASAIAKEYGIGTDDAMLFAVGGGLTPLMVKEWDTMAAKLGIKKIAGSNNYLDKDVGRIAAELEREKYIGAKAAYVAKGGNAKIADDILSKRRFISASAKAKILADMGKAGLLVTGAGTPVLNFATLFTKKNLWLTAGIGAFAVVFKWILYLPTTVQNYIDQGAFAPDQANRIFDTVGIPFHWPAKPGELFGEDDPTQTLNIVLADLLGQGYRVVTNPATGVDEPLTFATLNVLMQTLEARSRQTFPGQIKAEVVTEMQRYLKGDSVSVASPYQTPLDVDKKPSTQDGARTIIRLVTEQKPEQFLGTLFSFKMGDISQFDRELDDEITDLDDLRADVNLNFSRWLRTLKGRLGGSIVIRKNPVDETGVMQSGIWATMTTHILLLSGKIVPIDTVLLGPVKPETRMQIQKWIHTVEAQIPELLDAKEVREIKVPVGIVDIFTPEGNRATMGTESGQITTQTPAPTPAVATPTPIATPAPAPAAGGGATTVATPAPAPQPAPAPSPVIGPKLEEAILYRTNTGAKTLNVRGSPGTANPIIANLPNGSSVMVLESAGNMDGYSWVRIRFSASGETARYGYAATEFLVRV